MICRRAFTLIELLAASALAALIMLVLTQVIGSIARNRNAISRSMNDHSGQSQWKRDVLDLLRDDLAGAVSARLEDGRIRLTGHRSIDRQRLRPAQVPVDVVYEMRRDQLLRRQRGRDGKSRDNDFDEVVCAGVRRFTLEPAAAGAGQRRGGARINVPRDPLTIPLRVRVEGPTGVLIDEVIIAR